MIPLPTTCLVLCSMLCIVVLPLLPHDPAKMDGLAGFRAWWGVASKLSLAVTVGLGENGAGVET